MSANYENFQHYITEGWSKNPKEIFKFLEFHLAQEQRHSNTALLDVGCATGEFLYYLSSRYPEYNFTGIDVFDDLINQCKNLQPEKEFIKASILHLPEQLKGKFDVVTVVGVMSIFDESELSLFFDNLFAACRPGASIYILSPFNEFGVDCEIKHRKRIQEVKGNWEKGWNVFSKETIAELIQDRCNHWSFHPFRIGFDIKPKEDPVRTWTLKTEHNNRQLTNGLKLLVDHYLLKISL
ncbi:class I SAM-dependent methyltransferase [Legionella worsleiensis]|uniref:Putative Methyltransferase n=1 Tax=Legionella worsleiensis TaxID=45076 RepID=A0A0W1A3E8_9GAMM|nr:class I SAM-dependent methyltransferase [Legionella worsleiensis]KTD75871.1 putative Methyltransferase [Legionella worsleiensis]STY32884.1 putative Methyltransferase [Legionella worsleiensis]